MTNRIDRRFAQLRAAGRAGLITFIMAGDPNRDVCLKALEALPEAGADLIEIGMPFTDPMADGPVIQAAGLRSLAAGADMKMTLGLVQAFRQKDAETPIILMGYFNPIYSYGTDRFAADAAESGVDGLIIVDLPPEEDRELYEPARKAGLHLIRLVTPVTTAARLDAILTRAEGFLYYVSITGITGTARGDHARVLEHVAAIRAKTDLPVAAGFGIRTPEDVQSISKGVDAVVVGSAIVQTVADLEKGEKTVQNLMDQVSELAAPLTGKSYVKKASA